MMVVLVMTMIAKGRKERGESFASNGDDDNGRGRWCKEGRKRVAISATDNLGQWISKKKRREERMEKEDERDNQREVRVPRCPVEGR